MDFSLCDDPSLARKGAKINPGKLDSLPALNLGIWPSDFEFRFLKYSEEF